MSKIVVAVNSMIENSSKLSNIIRGSHSNEIYFLFDKKHKWSINKVTDGYILIYYPGKQALEFYASLEAEEWEEHSDYVVYTTKDIGTKEGLESFADLYGVVKEKVYGMDDVLNDIINTPPF
ncbi:hypothetical protein [Pseudomonas nunensis]|uniref:hypothetical protein n=1 Tax=Pseudomonas nunensis TaxID=2961896 RepID=UPI0006B4D3FF|nr:hypothetical protein [Pseudomonas nunensis]KOY02215.1 hypothetical protein AM274_13675 [Pseudomonas nunensis]